MIRMTVAKSGLDARACRHKVDSEEHGGRCGSRARVVVWGSEAGTEASVRHVWDGGERWWGINPRSRMKTLCAKRCGRQICEPNFLHSRPFTASRALHSLHAATGKEHATRPSQLGEQTGERNVWSKSNRLTTKGQATSDGSPAIKLSRPLVGQAQERSTQ